MSGAQGTCFGFPMQVVGGRPVGQGSLQPESGCLCRQAVSRSILAPCVCECLDRAPRALSGKLDVEEVLRVKSISDILGGRTFSFGARRPESLTESARRFNAAEIADTDFFAVARPSLFNLRVVSFAALALIAGSAAIGVTISSMRSDTQTVAASQDASELEDAAVATGPSASEPGLKTASLAPVSSTKGDFNGEIAKVVSASPMQSMSVAYLQTASFGSNPVGSGEISYPAPTSDALAYSQPTVLESSLELPALASDSGNFTSVAKTLPAEPIDEVIVLKSGETLTQRLVELGVTLASARAVASAIEPVYPGRLVKVGQNYTITLDKEQDFYGNEVIAPVRVSFTPPGGEEIIVESDDDGRYMAMIDGKQARPVSQVADAPHFRTRAKITSSLYATAKDNGVPTHIINAAMKVLSYEIDLQRQIQAGDTLELFYGIPLTGSSTKRKVLHYAKLRSSGRDHIYYRYTDAEGKTAFYDENGVSANKSLMRTPISGVRITSGFGMRRHPLLGYNKLHTGIDFGAPRGTPIKAAGDGVVEHAGWRGAYGRTVIIKHDGRYSTLYAHMSRTASLKAGQKVRQGQVIGYVGSTGRSTGPHLHYEVRMAGKPINPRRVQLATTTRLSGKELANFKRQKNRIMAMMETAPSSVQIAQVSANPN